MIEAADARLAALVREGEPGPGAPVWRRVLLVLVGLVGFALGCEAMSSWIDDLAPGARLASEVPRSKYRYFARSADDYDLVFVGSSRVYREFVPEVFDARLAEGGTEVRSFNFGMGGMRHPEIRHVVRWILEREPSRLRWLVIELTGETTESLGLPLHEENPFSERVIAWHRPDITWLVIEAFLAGDYDGDLKLAAVRSHLLHLAYGFTNTGDGVPALKDLFGYGREGEPKHRRTAGHVSLDDEGRTREDLRERHEEFLADPSEYDEELAAKLAQEPVTEADPILLASLKAMAAEVRAAGIVPVFVIMPPHWREGVEAFTPETPQGLENLFVYGDPRRYPEFYERDHLYNLRHLNERGARLFTRRFARDFARHFGLESD